MTTDKAEQSGLALICEVGAAITSSLVLEDVLTSVAQRVAETIRRMMAESLFEGFPSREEVHVTVSVGVATFPDHAGSAFELIVNADKALYLAKRTGKDRVRVFDSGKDTVTG